MVTLPDNVVPQVDIAIIGGGVSGSSLAITMQRAGWSTAVIEREPVFRDRVRGEACHPWGVKELLELDLMPFVQGVGGLELPAWTRYRDQQFDMDFRWHELFPGTPPEIGFSHPLLQEALLQGAAAAGALVYRPAHASMARQRDSWLLHIEHDERTTDIRARFLVAADGKNSSTRKLWGAETITDPPHHTMGGMLVKHVDLPQASARQGYYDGGFSMFFPQGNDHWRIYLVDSPGIAQSYTGPGREQRFMRACAETVLAGAFDSAVPVGPLAFFHNSHILATRIHGPFAVAIGDAAGAGDPTQGHGMSLVWRDVRELRDLLLGQDLPDVAAAYAAKRRDYEHILRTHAAWVAPIIIGTDAFSAALQAQVEAARAADPSALGYSGIFAKGPDGLQTDDMTRAQFFGELITDDPVRYSVHLDKHN